MEPEALALDEEAPEEERIVIDLKEGIEQEAIAAPEIEMAPAAEVNLDSLTALASTMSSGNVQVYSLDGDVTEPILKKPVRPRFKEVPREGYALGNIANNSNVEIIPLDNRMAEALNLPGAEATMRAWKSDSPDLEPLGDEPQGGFVDVQVPGHKGIRIYFDHDSFILDEGKKGAIATAAEKYRPAPGSYINVEGHASVTANIKDPMQRKVVNLKVSMDRAFAVARALMEKGVPAEMIKAVGWGEVKPSGPVNGMDAESASRRVEIFPDPVQ